MKKERSKNYADTRTDTPDLERRRLTQLIAAVSVLGVGLGVNMREAFGGERVPKPRPGADAIKWQEQPATEGTMPGGRPARPGVRHDKWIDDQQSRPSAEHTKRPDQQQMGVPARPGVTQAKPVPANRPGAGFAKHQGRPGAVSGKVESQPLAPGVLQHKLE